jgi:hypothetical protein
LRYPGLNRQLRLLHIRLVRSVHPLCMIPSLQCEPQDPGLCQAFKRRHGVLMPAGSVDNPSLPSPDFMRLSREVHSLGKGGNTLRSPCVDPVAVFWGASLHCRHGKLCCKSAGWQAAGAGAAQPCQHAGVSLEMHVGRTTDVCETFAHLNASLRLKQTT